MEFTLATTIPEGLERVRNALGDAGFGVLTEIDVSGTLRTKLGVETQSAGVREVVRGLRETVL